MMGVLMALGWLLLTLLKMAAEPQGLHYESRRTPGFG